MTNVSNGNQELADKAAHNRGLIIGGLLKIFFWWCKDHEIKVEDGMRSPDGKGRLLNQGELTGYGSLESRSRR